MSTLFHGHYLHQGNDWFDWTEMKSIKFGELVYWEYLNIVSILNTCNSKRTVQVLNEYCK